MKYIRHSPLEAFTVLANPLVEIKFNHWILLVKRSKRRQELEGEN